MLDRIPYFLIEEAEEERHQEALRGQHNRFRRVVERWKKDDDDDDEMGGY